MTAEQLELMRIAAQRILDDHAAGRKLRPDALDWARHVVDNIKPLGRPLSTGEPSDQQLPLPLRSGALEVF